MENYISMRSSNNKRIISIKFKTSWESYFGLENVLLFTSECAGLKVKLSKLSPPQHTHHMMYIQAGI